MSLFGFPEGLAGGSKETEYLSDYTTTFGTDYTTNHLTDKTTNYGTGVLTTNAPTFWNTQHIRQNNVGNGQYTYNYAQFGGTQHIAQFAFVRVRRFSSSNCLRDVWVKFPILGPSYSWQSYNHSLYHEFYFINNPYEHNTEVLTFHNWYWTSSHGFNYRFKVGGQQSNLLNWGSSFRYAYHELSLWYGPMDFGSLETSVLTNKNTDYPTSHVTQVTTSYPTQYDTDRMTDIQTSHITYG